MDRSDSKPSRPDDSLRAELRSSLLLLCILLGPILGLVALVHEHDQRAARHEACARAPEGHRPCVRTPTTIGP